MEFQRIPIKYKMEIVQLNPRFFETHLPSSSFFRRWEKVSAWNEGIFPIYEWQDVLFVGAAYEPDNWQNNLKSKTHKICLVLCEAEALKEVWKKIQSSPIRETQKSNVDIETKKLAEASLLTPQAPPAAPLIPVAAAKAPPPPPVFTIPKDKPLQPVPAIVKSSSTPVYTEADFSIEDLYDAVNLSPDEIVSLKTEQEEAEESSQIQDLDSRKKPPPKKALAMEMPEGLGGMVLTQDQATSLPPLPEALIPNVAAQVPAQPVSSTPSIAPKLGTLSAAPASVSLPPMPKPVPPEAKMDALLEMPDVPPPTLNFKAQQESSLDAKSKVAMDANWVTEVFDKLNPHFRRSMILKVESNKAEPWNWNPGLKPLNNKIPSIDLKNPSPFYVVSRTLKPYHGQPPKNELLQQFCSFWSQGDDLQSVSVLPLTVNGSLVAMIFAESEGEGLQLNKLQIAQNIADDVQQILDSHPEALKAAS